MKILFLTTHLNVGGITTYLMTLCREFVRRGHDVTIASSGGNREDDFAALGVGLLFIQVRTKCELSWNLWSAQRQLRPWITSQGVDVIHAQTRVTQVLGSWLKRRTAAAYCSTCHGFFTPKWARNVFPGWGQVVIAISPAVQRHLREDFHWPDQKIALVPNGVDVEDFPLVAEKEKAARRRAMGLPDGRWLGIIARLSDVKGHGVLITAMQEVVRDLPQARLLIVGEGKMERALRAQVKAAALEGHIHFSPVVNRTAEILSLLDIFVLPSLQEGLGLSVMEAQASALPVVASAVGGIPSLIEDGQTGRLVPANDSRALAAAIVETLRLPDGGRAMGLRAREFIGREFSARLMAKETLRVYQRIIAEKVAL